MSNSPTLKRHSFQPGAMSIIQMGEELIGHPSTAVNELVKNGYDADALLCQVYFYYSKDKKKSFAVIADNGSGMDDKTLFGDWLKPSVSSKRKQDAKSELYSRSLLGSKGIGRLAAMALGERVTVISRKDPKKKYNWITINRGDFKEEKLLSEIDFPGDVISDYINLFTDKQLLKERKSLLGEDLLLFLRKSGFDSLTKGTLIVIESLDDSVLKILHEDFRQLEFPGEEKVSYRGTRFYKALATLITPLSLNDDIQKELQKKRLIKSLKSVASDKSRFAVKYSTNLLPDQSKNKIDWLDVEPVSIQTVYDYRVYGKVSSNGEVIGIMDYQRLEEHKFDEPFTIEPDNLKDENENQQSLFDDDEENFETGEYYFDIRVYDIGEKDNLEKLARLSKIDSASGFRNTFKEFQGLRISKNGFGVKPYGEEVEDWIGLSKARVQNPGQNVNTNQILGYVFFFFPSE